MSYYNDPQKGMYAQQQEVGYGHGPPAGYQQGYGAAPGGQQQGQPPSGPAHQHSPPETQDNGNYNGIQYSIKHRNTNSTLEFQLTPGQVVKSRAGAMVRMSGSVQMQGALNFSFKKLFTDSQIAETSYTGPGTVVLAPTLTGDIFQLEVRPGDSTWKIGKHCFLASTPEIVRDTKSQGLMKGMFSGGGLFVYHITGSGMVWLTSYGAIEPVRLQPGEEHIIDNDHLVAWNCDYKIERAGKGISQAAKTGEGLVCRFTGPGVVYVQTRNLEELANWVRAQVPNKESSSSKLSFDIGDLVS